MRLKLLGALAISAALVFTGCTTNEAAAPAAPAAKKELSAPTPKVAGLIKKYNLEVVDFEYTKEAVGSGTRLGARALLIDSRPPKMYAKSTIPSSINIPDTKFDEYVGQLDKVAKDKEILVYCGGWHCAKSPKVAGLLKAKGFTNVKLYQAGEPEWKKKSYMEVGTPVLAAAYKNNSVLFIDGRPYHKFISATIPGAISISDTHVEELMGRFPADKNTPIITFCSGFYCPKSRLVTEKLLSLGYTDVRVYGGGFPAWEKAGMPTTGVNAKVLPKEEPKATGMVNGIKLGLDEGTVDGEWFKANYKTLKNIQIIDVRSAEEHAAGSLAGGINIPASSLDAKTFISKLPKDQVIVFHCAAGGRALEAWEKANDGGADMSKIFYFDANIECKKNDCKIEVNEPLG